MQTWVRRSLELGFLALLTVTCERPSDGGAAAPGLDNNPPAETSDGQVVGADNKSPQHLLAEQGTTAHPAPGWKIDKNGVAYDPKRQPGEGKGATTITEPDGGVETVPARSGSEPAPLPEK
ncbi:MAG TPA: hypothetical protein VMI54_09155 [Polyangiaceae bacterium]|nr:hypothetical protein [Polyangiaceae bacterium]